MIQGPTCPSCHDDHVRFLGTNRPEEDGGWYIVGMSAYEDDEAGIDFCPWCGTHLIGLPRDVRVAIEAVRALGHRLLADWRWEPRPTPGPKMFVDQNAAPGRFYGVSISVNPLKF